MATAQARDTFATTRERVRRWHGYYLAGFVVPSTCIR